MKQRTLLKIKTYMYMHKLQRMLHKKSHCITFSCLRTNYVMYFLTSFTSVSVEFSRTGLIQILNSCNTQTSPKMIANKLKTRFGVILHIFSHICGSNQPILMQFFCFKAYYVAKLVFGVEREKNPANH